MSSENMAMLNKLDDKLDDLMDVVSEAEENPFDGDLMEEASRGLAEFCRQAEAAIEKLIRAYEAAMDVEEEEEDNEC